MPYYGDSTTLDEGNVNLTVSIHSGPRLCYPLAFPAYLGLFMRVSTPKILSAALLSLALVGCGSDTPPPQQASSGPDQAAVSPAPETAAPEQAPADAPLTNEQVGQLSLEVFNKFKQNFPQAGEFTTPPVVVRIEPTAGAEVFEIITPHGVYYTDRNARWLVEGVLFMADPSADTAQAQATGLPTPMINITMRPDLQRVYANLRDKEAGVASMGGQQISGKEFFESMPRDKAVVITYGNPDIAPGQNREVVLIGDMDDQGTHALFAELASRDSSTLNLRVLLFPVALEEIRPYTLARSGALLCAGFDPSNPTAHSAEGVNAVWKKYISDLSTADLSEQAWQQWAQANNVAVPAAETCLRALEPGVFTRLTGALGLVGTPRVALANGETLVGKFTVDQLLEAMSRPAQPVEQAQEPTAPQQ